MPEHVAVVSSPHGPRLIYKVGSKWVAVCEACSERVATGPKGAVMGAAAMRSSRHAARHAAAGRT